MTDAMNAKHELEWVYRRDFNFEKCGLLTMTQDFSYSHLEEKMEYGYEIQRIEIELHDGYIHRIQSRTRNIIGFKKMYVSVSAATGLTAHEEVYHYERWTFRILDIKEIRIWYATPAYMPQTNNRNDNENHRPTDAPRHGKHWQGKKNDSRRGRSKVQSKIQAK